MPGSFFDSNILLYLASDDAKKADVAERLLASGGAISVQVLNEIANVARRKMRMDWRETHAFLALIRHLVRVAPLTLETHDTGMALAETYGFSTYDSMIVAAALLEGCDVLLSEDMQDGLLVREQLRIFNPFRTITP
jgi:predicted nucleic acid-binding protein